MADRQPTADPYRILGILRGADLAEVKSAHRRLAKLYHPDGATGDEARFLAVQEAYQLLSDPARRRAWDRQHAPGPVRSTAAGRRTGPRGPRRGGGAGPAMPRPPQPPRDGSSQPGPHGVDGVPWWEDFRPGARAEDDTRSAPVAPDDGNEFDVFSRSSGAAWSAAARRHFRRDTADLPSRGVWRYRGTQVVTGAEARKVAGEEQEPGKEARG